jgi:cytidylate kinase
MHAATDTILKLAELGNVILIGRGANLITAKLDHVLHVRLVGSLEKRIARVAEHLSLEPKAAREFVEKADRGHQRYIREHFKAEIENPLLYDLVINTDRISCEQAAVLIADTLLNRPPAARD